MAPNRRRSTLTPLYLIADLATARRSDVDLRDVVAGFLAGGGRMVSLRTKGVDDRRAMEVGAGISGRVFAAGGVFFVHRRLDLAALLGADGVHLPSSGFRSRAVRSMLGADALHSRSCHSKSEFHYAIDDEAHFATLGPLFESVSKPGYGPALDNDEFREICEDSETPVYALGGVVPENVQQCFDAGARGVAVVGGIVGADSPRRATIRYRQAIEDARRAAKN